jgi:F-type H+-transporting ATPase subunit a
MPEHQDWFSILLGGAWERLQLLAGKNLGTSWLGHEPLTLHHVAGALLVLVVTLILAIRAVIAQAQANGDPEKEGGLVPDRGLTARNFFELFCELILGQMEKQMGRERARKYFPLIASFALFILLSNVQGLIPGLIPPTDKLDTTVPLALTSFLAYHIYGVGANGLAYFKHFLGPVLPDIRKPSTYPAILLVFLLFPIEIFSHLARVLSLSVRLMVNLFADHTMLAIFYGLFALFIPLPIMALGVLVVIIQTVVFTLLSIIYISLATEHHDHGDDHGKAHAADHAAHP